MGQNALQVLPSLDFIEDMNGPEKRFRARVFLDDRSSHLALGIGDRIPSDVDSLLCRRTKSCQQHYQQATPKR